MAVQCLLPPAVQGVPRPQQCLRAGVCRQAGPVLPAGEEQRRVLVVTRAPGCVWTPCKRRLASTPVCACALALLRSSVQHATALANCMQCGKFQPLEDFESDRWVLAVHGGDVSQRFSLWLGDLCDVAVAVVRLPSSSWREVR